MDENYEPLRKCLKEGINKCYIKSVAVNRKHTINQEISKRNNKKQKHYVYAKCRLYNPFGSLKDRAGCNA